MLLSGCLRFQNGPVWRTMFYDGISTSQIGYQGNHDAKWNIPQDRDNLKSTARNAHSAGKGMHDRFSPISIWCRVVVNQSTAVMLFSGTWSSPTYLPW